MSKFGGITFSRFLSRALYERSEHSPRCIRVALECI
jgi:hypothetical protein